MHTRAPIARLARSMKVLLFGAMGVSVMTLPVSLETARRARAYLADPGQESRFLAAAGTQNLLTSLTIGLTVPIGVLTMIWMLRMARNHQTMGRYHPNWAPGWAIGGWFCPPVLQVIPWLMLRELWKASDPQCAPFDDSWRKRPVSPITTVWWVLYGLAPILGLVLTFRRLNLGTTFDQRSVARVLDAPASLTITTSLISLAAAAAFLTLVHQLSARHRKLVGEE